MALFNQAHKSYIFWTYFFAIVIVRFTITSLKTYKKLHPDENTRNNNFSWIIAFASAHYGLFYSY